MKRLLTSALICCSLAAASQTGIGLGIGASPRNNGAVVGSAFFQQDIITPRDLNLRAGLGGLVAIEGKQANHLVAYTYGAMEIGPSTCSLRFGVTRTWNIDDRLEESQSRVRSYTYAAFHMEETMDVNQTRAGFLTISYSHNNWFELSMGLKIKL